MPSIHTSQEKISIDSSLSPSFSVISRSKISMRPFSISHVEDVDQVIDAWDEDLDGAEDSWKGDPRRHDVANGTRIGAISRRALRTMPLSAERIASFLLECHADELRRMVDEEDESAQYSLQVS